MASPAWRLVTILSMELQFLLLGGNANIHILFRIANSLCDKETVGITVTLNFIFQSHCDHN